MPNLVWPLSSYSWLHRFVSRPWKSQKCHLCNKVKQDLLVDSMCPRKLVRAMGLSVKCRVSTRQYALLSAHHQSWIFIVNHFVTNLYGIFVYLFTMSLLLSGPQRYRQTPSRQQSQTGSARRFNGLEKVGQSNGPCSKVSSLRYSPTLAQSSSWCGT